MHRTKYIYALRGSKKVVSFLIPIHSICGAFIQFSALKEDEVSLLNPIVRVSTLKFVKCVRQTAPA